MTGPIMVASEMALRRLLDLERSVCGLAEDYLALALLGRSVGV